MKYLVIPIIAFLVLGGLAFFSFRLASNRSPEGEDFEGARRGCLLTLANLLLRPVPVILAFYLFGFVAAVIAALTIWFILRVLDVYKSRSWSGSDLGLFLLPLGAGMTLFTGNSMYFQLLPSAWCVFIALQQLDGLIRGKAHLFPGSSGETVFSENETKAARWGILFASLVALLISEHFRHNLSLSGWIWYYGYLRLELLPIFLGSTVPAMMKLKRRVESEPN